MKRRLDETFLDTSRRVIPKTDVLRAGAALLRVLQR